MRNILVLLVLSFGIFSCNEQNNKKMNDTSSEMGFMLPEWAKASTIYEVNIRQYTKEGTINAFSDHIPRLKELGVDIIWLMPVFPISETKRKGTLGSYYAVSDFRSVNPEFGTLEDLKNLIDKIHAYKMKVILDWVPNHTGWDHTWIKSHPDFYTKGPDGNITDPLDPATGKSYGWSDVADLNYDNKNMRAAMISDLIHWVKDYNVDGYRMDIAFGVPLDFWKDCSDTLFKTRKDLFMWPKLKFQNNSMKRVFIHVMGWSFFHLMNAIAKGEKDAAAIDHWLKSERQNLKREQSCIL